MLIAYKWSNLINCKSGLAVYKRRQSRLPTKAGDPAQIPPSDRPSESTLAPSSTDSEQQRRAHFAYWNCQTASILLPPSRN